MAGNAESERSTDMENEVWSEISAFLNNLRCGDVSRKSYLHFPELEEAALGIYGRRTGILSRICGLYSVVRWLGDIE